MLNCVCVRGRACAVGPEKRTTTAYPKHVYCGIDAKQCKYVKQNHIEYIGTRTFLAIPQLEAGRSGSTLHELLAEDEACWLHNIPHIVPHLTRFY